MMPRTRCRLILFVLCLFHAALDRVTALSSSHTKGIRLNKVFKETHSRRKADLLIEQGRVKVNGETVHDMGRRVVPFVDVVHLDGTRVRDWELSNGCSEENVEKNQKTTRRNGNKTQRGTKRPFQHVYIKYWKPVGVTCTTDPLVRGNLLEAMGLAGGGKGKSQSPTTKLNQRIFSVGRLDKDSSGLLLLTSDGRVPNAVLRKEVKQPKVYHVQIEPPFISDKELQRLRSGVVITTDTVRQGRHRAVTAKTLPCRVSRAQQRGTLVMELTEGRNRQIRVMLAALGYQVAQLHRCQFLGLDLSGLQGPGDWTTLSVSEQRLLDAAVERGTRVASVTNDNEI